MQNLSFLKSQFSCKMTALKLIKLPRLIWTGSTYGITKSGKLGSDLDYYVMCQGHQSLTKNVTHLYCLHHVDYDVP